MTPAEIIIGMADSIEQVAEDDVVTHMLRYLSNQVQDAQLNSGARVLDATDFKLWMEELAVEIEKALS